MMSASKRCSVRLYRMLFAGRFVSYLRYMCLFAYIGTHIDYMGNMGMSYRRQGLLFLRGRLDSSRFLVGPVMLVFLVFYVFALFIFCHMCRVLPFSLDCPFLIALSVFSNVYLSMMV